MEKKLKYVRCCKCGDSCTLLGAKIVWNEVKGKKDFMCKNCFNSKWSWGRYV